ncbi:MAG TPA: penicillin-binding protein 1C [Candidatus Binataceae bacterium]|nr:penicillin-binding protein 1C [Candidatus Binataceae bacterium]
MTSAIPKIGRQMRAIVGCAGAILLTGAIGWVAAGWWPKPMLVNQSGFSQAVYDRNGHLLRLTLSTDEKYRLWVPLTEIPPAMIQATLLQEDAWFRWHPGVNPFSLIRAFLTTYVRRGRRMGGSTITMQLARNRFGIDSRTLPGKIEQILRAFQLERFYSKDAILEAYLNTVPYGGNVEGVAAASTVYFGKEPRYLSLPEILTLAVIPQHPASRSRIADPGITPLVQARSRLAAQWRSTHPAADIPDSTLGVTAVSRRELPFKAPHLVDRVIQSDALSGRIATTLDSDLQDLLDRQLRMFVERGRRLGINNGAAILVDYRTMEIKGYAGSADYFSRAINGEVDGLRGRRSPGSALKPFIYALAIDEGLIHPQTMLKDTPLRIAAYNPENFDRDFLGPVDATSALVRSRNVPAIEVANMLEPPGFYGFLKQAGVKNLRDPGFYGLALALGGAEVSMEEMAGLYAMLANGGLWQPLAATDPPQPAAPSTRLLSPEAAYIVLDMLRSNPRPSSSFTLSQAPRMRAIPWKTGTSFGFRDAWALGIAGPYVLGVWIGNFDGTPNPNFIGREAAGPLFFNIVDALAAREPLVESIVHGPLNLKKVKVCALSGQLPGPHCDHLKETWFIPGKSPILTCQIHRKVLIDAKSGHRACPGQASATIAHTYEFWPSDLQKLFRSTGIARRTPPAMGADCAHVATGGVPPSISSPARGISYSAPGAGSSEIPFAAVTDADSRLVYWFVDNELVGTARSGESLYWKARAGNFLVRAVDEQGRSAAEELNVVVPAR